MRIIVCTKETPDTAARVEVTADGAVSWGDAPLVINPWDEYAVEEAILLKDQGATSVTVVGAGGDSTKEALKHALAMGVDDALHITGSAIQSADVLQLSKVLASAIARQDDVVLAMFGKMTTDGGSGQMAAQVGRRLGWNILTYVSSITDVDFVAGTIRVERLLEEGKQIVESRLPAVISVVKEINEPRYPSFMGIRKASRAEIPEVPADELGLNGGAKVMWPEITALPPREGECEIIEADSVDSAAAALVERLIEEKVV